MWRSSPRWRVCRCEEVGVGLVEDDIVVGDASAVDVVIDANLVVSVVDVNSDVVDGDDEDHNNSAFLPFAIFHVQEIQIFLGQGWWLLLSKCVGG